MKRYLTTYLPALLISIILFLMLPQEYKYLIYIPVIISGLLYSCKK